MSCCTGGPVRPRKKFDIFPPARLKKVEPGERNPIKTKDGENWVFIKKR